MSNPPPDELLCKNKLISTSSRDAFVASCRASTQGGAPALSGLMEDYKKGLRAQRVANKHTRLSERGRLCGAALSAELSCARAVSNGSIQFATLHLHKHSCDDSRL